MEGAPMTTGDSLIGLRLPRPGARRLAAGRGTYVDDVELPGMVHMALVRSPYAHAKILALETAEAAAAEGVIKVIAGTDLEEVCQPFTAAIDFLPDMVSPPQYALAISEVAWQGEAVCAVIAESRAQAEDGADLVRVDWEELPTHADPTAALSSDAQLVHSALPSNLAMALPMTHSDVAAAEETAAVIMEQQFEFGRQAGWALEPRSIVADFNPGDGSLIVYQSHQTPFQMQDLYARHLGIDEHKVRVIAKDVGGAFGVKLHAYPDEMAAVAISRLVGRPVKYVADRQESFLSDIHAREMNVKGRLALDEEGRILAFSADVLSAAGAYSVYPRTSVGEGIQALQFVGAPYNVPAFDGRVRVAYQNKTPSGAYRAVGMPIGCTVTEQLLDWAAAAQGIDPVEIRRRNYLDIAEEPVKTPGGLIMGPLSLGPCLDRILEDMDYDALRRDQEELRRKGIYRGIGLATFVEQTAVGAGLYGPMGVRVAAHEGCTLRLEPSGKIRGSTSATDQGQGTLAGLCQVVAATLGVAYEDVTIEAGDGGASPYGGGAWASRGLAIGGEAARQAAEELKQRLLTAAAAILQQETENLDMLGAQICTLDGQTLMPLDELSSLLYFRQDTLPPQITGEPVVTSHYIPRDTPYFMANGIQASHLEVDTETGVIRLLDHWVVEDCGRVINPLLVDEQLRGGIVQGIGAALYENCIYDERGQLQNASMADYALPLAAEMPDIWVSHIETPAPDTGLGAKGSGEAGALGAPAAIWTAVNDALRPLGAQVWKQPITSAHVLEVLTEAEEKH